MSPIPLGTLCEIAANGLARMFENRAPEWTPLPDGGRARLRISHDEHASLPEDGDWFGELTRGYSYRYDKHAQRPAHFDGAARKIHARDGFVWWQPPADARGDAERLKWLHERIQDYYRDGWTFTLLKLEYESAPCACCGVRRGGVDYLGGVESDISAESLADFVADLILVASIDARTTQPA